MQTALDISLQHALDSHLPTYMLTWAHTCYKTTANPLLTDTDRDTHITREMLFGGRKVISGGSHWVFLYILCLFFTLHSHSCSYTRFALTFVLVYSLCTHIRARILALHSHSCSYTHFALTFVLIYSFILIFGI